MAQIAMIVHFATFLDIAILDLHADKINAEVGCLAIVIFVERITGFQARRLLLFKGLGDRF